jgi:hypothetical protein
MDDVTRTNELPSPSEPYEPPRLDELGKFDEFTAGPADGDSVTVTTV